MENAQNGSETWENIHRATVWSNQVWWMGSGNNFSLLLPGNLIYDRVQENGISMLCLNWRYLLFTWKIQEYEKLAVTLNEARHELSDKVRELSRSASRASLVEEAERHSQSLQELAKQLEEWVGRLGVWPQGLLEPGRKYWPGWGAAPRTQVWTQLIPSCIFGAEPRRPQPRISIGQMKGEVRGLGRRQRPQLEPSSRTTFQDQEERQWGWAGALCCGRCHRLREHPQRHQSGRGCGRQGLHCIWGCSPGGHLPWHLLSTHSGDDSLFCFLPVCIRE